MFFARRLLRPAKLRQLIPTSGQRTRQIRPSLETLEGRLVMNASSLVSSFGNGGVALTPLNDGMGTSFISNQVIAVATQSDGKVIEAENRKVATNTGNVYSLTIRRYTASGTLDLTFGTNGQTVLTDFYASINSLVTGTDGSIFFGGAAGFNLVVGRLTADGRLDSTFGTNGLASLPNTLGYQADLSVQKDGKVVLVGVYVVSSDYDNANLQINVARLTTTGAFDTSFNGTGQLRYRLNSGSGSIIGLYSSGVAVAPSGQIYVAASAPFPSSSVGVNGSPLKRTELTRINANGTIDTTYASSGTRSLNLTEVTHLAVQTDGRVLLAGSNEPVIGNGFAGALTRLNPDGSTDSSFQTTNGAATTGIASRFYSFDSMRLGDNGTITVAGGLTVARFLSSGAVDRSFGLNGLITLNTNVLDPALPFNSGTYLNAPLDRGINGLALTSDGNLIVGGINLIEQGFLAKLQPTTLHAVPNDYDSDGKSDLAVEITNGPNFIYRPSSGGANIAQPFGVVGVGKTLLAPGDYSGSGVTNVAGFLPETGLYAYRPTRPVSDVTIGFDVSSTRTVTPAPGDYNGDGKTDMTVFDSSTASFSMTISTVNSYRYPTIPFGQPGAGNSIPTPGDYDGDGITDLAVFLPNFGVLAYRPSRGGNDVLIAFGQKGAGNSIPTPGDYDGDGATDLSVYIPKLAIYAYRPSSGGNDVLTYFGAAGVGSSIPTPGDYDGDGKTDLSVYIPASTRFAGDGRFAYRPSGGGGDVIRMFGFSATGQVVPAAANPAALGAAYTSAGSSARGVSSAVDIPLTVDLTSPTVKKKTTGTA